ncbi:MAG: hypothetical protein ABEJ96_06510 [Thiohalorhabdaceae bacterium]
MALHSPIRAVTALAAAGIISGCATVDDTLDSATDAAVYGVTGPRASSEAPASGASASGGGTPPPMAIHRYSMALFQAMFYQGGYNLATQDFEPGEYVHWTASGMGAGDWFKKALLKRRDDGSEWWRLIAHNDGDTVTMEPLFSPPEEGSNRRVLRLRVQYPDEQPKEVPITEEDSQRWVLQSQRTLTAESYKGLKVGVADVTVPAGTFTADHLQTSHPGQGGTVNWYVSDTVPGGVVKFRWQHEDDKRVLELKDFGDGRTTSKLGAF